MKLITLLMFLSFSLLAECLQNRAAFDIGSGSTKMKVAKVDTCKKKVIKVLLEESIPVAYKEDLKKADSFSNEIKNAGIKALIDLKIMANRFKPKYYWGVATSAFRTSENGQEFAKEIENRLAIKVKVIDQKQEALIGHNAVIAKGYWEDGLVVWDIGGGSMQMTAKSDDYEVFEGKLASVSFKNEIIEKLMKKDPEAVKTPNPIGNSTSKNAVEFAMKHAKENVSDKMKEVIAKAKKVIGIGGVHYYSLRKQVGNATYDEKLLGQALLKRSLLDDNAIGGKYASTEVSNIALVQGYMKALGIKDVTAEKINLADGVLISENF